MTHELIIGLHCHQPVGNFPFVFREAYEKSYRPILEALEQAPRVKVSLHYSGPLLEWLEQEELGYLERVKALVVRGQVELWGSGFYEPILPSIPRADRIDQVKMMIERIHGRFGVKPRGLWLTERVWEPTLASDLANAGVDYLAVDDHHFRLAGFDTDKIGGYYLTEDEGQTVGIFPIIKELRYRIPFAEPQKVLDYVKERAASGSAGPICFYDDGEKLGVWPRTFKAVWEDGWVKRLFDLLSDERSGVTTVLPATVRDRDRPQGRVYLPTASYPEMMEWAFPAATGSRFEDLLDRIEHGDAARYADAKPFLAGGFWRNFLVKYPEINFLQKRAVRLSKKLRALPAQGGLAVGPGQAAALQELFQAECNCAYWHGVFGGAYLPHLRRSLWTHLIRAEKALAPRGETKVETSDLEADGQPLVRIDTPSYTAHVKPGAGGVLLGFDLREPAYPLLDVIARRREAYHDRMVPLAQMPAGEAAGGIHGRFKPLPEGVEIVADWHRRASVVDHLYTELPSAVDLSRARVRDEGDFAIEPFTPVIEDRQDAVSIRLYREGGFFGGGRKRALRMTRTFTFSKKATSVSVLWKLENLSSDTIDAWHGTDWNLSLVPVEGFVHAYVKGPTGPELLHPDPAKPQAWSGPLPPQRPLTLEPRAFTECGFKDSALGKKVRLTDATKTAQVLGYPITTISQSESGVDMVHQGTCLTVLRPLRLEAGQSVSFACELVVE